MAFTERILYGLIAFAFATRFWLIFRLNINWDEFYFLSFVHDYVRGTLTTRLQTFHVHFFSWLPNISQSETTQVIAGRCVMGGLGIGSAFLIYGIGRQFLSRSGALFGVFSYLSLSNVVVHGTSFRADPLAAVLVLLALYAIFPHSRKSLWVIGAGVAVALATVVTIKTVIHLAMIAVVFLCLMMMGPDRRSVIRAAGMFMVAYGIALTALYLWHDSTLVASPTVDTNANLNTMASKVLLSEGLFPRWLYVMLSIQLNPITWVLLFSGALTAIGEVARSSSMRDIGERILPLVLALPLTTIIFYRNVFPYYFVFMLAPGILLTGVAYDHLFATAKQRGKGRAVLLPFALIFVVCCSFLGHVYQNSPDRTALQRQIVMVVHERFPQPVPYIDGYGMIASFPRNGFFMSTWGMDNYLTVGRPIYAELVATSAPPFLLANSPALMSVMFHKPFLGGRELLPDDVLFLRENYLRYWGLLHIVGKRIALPNDGSATFDIVVPGTYRLETEREVRVNGRLIVPGATVDLVIGKHEITTDQRGGEVVLRWAAVGPPPSNDPGDALMFVGFGR